MALDHPLCGKEGLYLLAEINDAAVLPKPVRALSPEAEALEAEADAGLALAVTVRLLVAFLSANPARVAARLSAHRALCLGRSGLALRGLGGNGH